MNRKPALESMLAVAGSVLLLSPAISAETKSADTAAPGDSIEEIVVTATKVAASELKVPVALTVISGDALTAAGINDPRLLGDLAPNVHLGQQTGKLEIAIRGIYSQDDTEKGDPSAAFNIDGAYIGRPEAQVTGLYDIDRVEILRGPQGTLYGRNATSGAINVITNKPTDTLEGRVTTELGNYNTVRTDAMFNVPVNDLLSVRVAINSNHRDSYFTDGPLNPGVPLPNQQDLNGRFHALFKFSPTTTLLLTSEISKIGGAGDTNVPLHNFYTGAFTGDKNNLVDPVYVNYGPSAQLCVCFQLPTAAQVGQENHKSIRTYADRALFNTDLGFAQLTYQYAYLGQDYFFVNLGNYFGGPIFGIQTSDSNEQTHEFRLSSEPGGDLTWVAGLYYLHERIDRTIEYDTQFPGVGDFQLHFAPHVLNESLAAFGQATYSIMSDLRLTGGVRFTRDKKSDADAVDDSAFIPLGTTPQFTADPFSESVTYKNTSWKVGMEKDLAPGVLLYGDIATGYKAGGFNNNAPPVVNVPYEPEKLTSYEIGVKGRFLDNTLQVTSGLYYYNYKDLQLSALVCPGGPNTCGTQVTNAANSTVRGFELEGKYLVIRGGLLNVSLGLNDAKFKTYIPSAGVDFSNQHLDFAPTTTLSAGYTQTLDLPNGGNIAPHIGTYYSASYLLSDPSAGVRYEQPSFHKSDARLTYNGATGKWYVEAFVKNIEDKITIEARNPAGFDPADPRTWGVRASVSF